MALGGLVIAALAIVLAALAWWRARSSAGYADSALRSSNAALRAVLAGREAAVPETATRPWQKLAPATDSAQAPPVVEMNVDQPIWQLTWNSGSTYQLLNASDEPAREVEINSRDDGPSLPNHESQDIGPGESITFAATTYLGMSDHRVTITWYRPGGDLRAWRTDLPL